MSSLVLGSFGSVELTLTAGQNVAVYTKGTAQVYQVVGYPNYPNSRSLLQTVTNTLYQSAALTNGGTIVIEAGAQGALYEVGIAATVQDVIVHQFQPDPVALNATGAVTSAAILGGIVTSTTAAAVAGTIPTGTVMDTATTMVVGDSVDWSVINTGGTNAFTVTAATGHTIVGAAAVAANTSGRFRTRKTAANTYITYRLA